MLICGGQYPVNPLTSRYIEEQLAYEGLPPTGAIQPLALLDLEELEGCQALHQRPRHHAAATARRLKSKYGAMAFRNYLAYEYGGKELGRPADVQGALADSFQIIQQRLGVPVIWSAVQDRTPWHPTTAA